MKTSFFTKRERQELLALELNRNETLRLKKVAEAGEDKKLCQQSIFTAELAIWKFFKTKLLQVTKFEEFSEIFSAVRRIFGDTCFIFELKESFDELLSEFRDFIQEQFQIVRRKLKKI